MKKKRLHTIYRILFEYYGPQGWWPLKSLSGKEGFDKRGYHRGLYRYPVNEQQVFEIIVGAILTQNTSWKNVERTIDILMTERCLSLQSIASGRKSFLASKIRSSGYYNQKAKKLKKTAEFFLSNPLSGEKHYPEREQLLTIWGIGEETADSILLYAFKKPWFVIDTYTKRIFTRLGILSGNEKYTDVQQLFHSHLEKDVTMYNEYHALLVEHAKKHCTKKPICNGCPLKRYCHGYNIS
jgi:endonuclease-3 related protein